MATVEVTNSHDYREPAERLWATFADPVIAATLDDRVTLVSMARQAGTVSSSYELDVAVGPLRMRQQVEVVEAVPPTLLKTVTSMQGRVAAVQTARIEPTETGCRVTWTVTMRASRLGAGPRRRRAKQELPKWLAAAEAASASGG